MPNLTTNLRDLKKTNISAGIFSYRTALAIIDEAVLTIEHLQSEVDRFRPLKGFVQMTPESVEAFEQYTKTIAEYREREKFLLSVLNGDFKEFKFNDSNKTPEEKKDD